MEFCLKKFVLNTANPHLKLSTRKIEQIVSILIQSYMRENNLKKINFIKGDITENLEIKEEFDIVFSKDTFEHILNPWDATKNIQKLLKNKGLVMFFVPFSWRYHASPYDTYRYSHTGIQYIIERLGKIKKIESGYIKFGDIKGFWKNKKDFTLDKQPFPKSLEAFYIGIKDENYVFKKENLDSDLSWDHSV